RRARDEDLAGTGWRHRPARRGDVTTRAVVDRRIVGRAELRARRPMVVCGLPLVPLVLAAYGDGSKFDPLMEDGVEVKAGAVLGRLQGPAHRLLAAERVLLNFLQHLS